MAARDDGATLVEVLLAVAILGVGIAALLGGLFTLQVGTDVHADEASGALYIRQYAEAVAAAPYVSCATAYSGVYSAPNGWTAPAQQVAYWNGTAFASACPATDSGLQRVSVTLATSDGRDTESLDVVKRAP